jgi:hypothetical protein
VSSQAKITANRTNGRNSRGPRSAAGKSKASRNALRHGFAAISRNNPEICAEIAPVARAICSDATDPLLCEQALIIAENAFVLRCVQTERLAAIERCREATVTALATGDLGFARAKEKLARAKLAYEIRVQMNTQRSPSQPSASRGIQSGPRSSKRRPADTAQRQSRQPGEGVAAQSGAPVTSIRERNEFEAMRAAMPDLDRLERYRRRAWSRVLRAIRRFVQIEQQASVARVHA